jgi:predicted phage terminase large subunit-like protein
MEETGASLCRESFYYFLQKFWDVLIPEPPVWNWHLKLLCDELQEVAERVFRGEPKAYDLLINIPPGTTKSTIVSIFFPAWVWTRMKSARVISGSYEHVLALTFARKSRLIIKHPRYQAMFGPIELREDQDTKGFYENTDGGDRKSVGTGGNITGSHGHFILVDDPINPKRAVSPASLKEVNTWMKDTLSSRKVDKNVTPTILVMQRLHQDDPSERMIQDGLKEGKAIRHICLPAELSDKVKPPRLRLKYKGGLLDPVRLSPKVLAEARVDLGQYGYAGQFDQNPVPAAGGMFKTERFKLDTPPREIEFTDIWRHWDKAGTDGDGDWTVGLKMARDRQKRLWILDVVRGQWDSSEREDIIEQTAKIDGTQCRISLEQEPGSSGKDSARATVIRLQGFRVLVQKPTGDKVTRADTFSVQVNMGNVYVDKNANWLKDFMDELKFFPFGKHDDQVDGCSGAFTAMTQHKSKLGAL